MSMVNISKPIHGILSELTGEERFEVALHLATKDLVMLKLQEVERQIKGFEGRYRMSFQEFQLAWENDQIADRHSYGVEKDFWDWEAAESDRVRLSDMLQKIPWLAEILFTRSLRPHKHPTFAASQS